MQYQREIEELLRDMAIDRRLLDSACFQSEAANELIDGKVFLNALKAIGGKSRKLLKFIMAQRSVTVEYVPQTECHLDKRVLQKPYTRVGRNVIFMPETFQGSISEFLDFLQANMKDMMAVHDALRDANRVFSEYITNPKDLNKMDTKRVPQLERMTTLPKEFAEWFGGAEGVDRAEMDSLYSSYADFGSSSTSIDTITKKFQDVELKLVKRAINDLYETIDIITNKITKDGVEVSKKVAQSIGNLIYNLADWTAMYSLYISKVVAVSKSHRDSAKRLNRLVSL